MTDPTKRCTHCKQIKPLSEFGKHKSQPDGYHYQCKECSNGMARAIYRTEKGRARKLAENRRSKQKHKEKRNAESREYNRLHWDRLREIQKKDRKNNPDRIRAKNNRRRARMVNLPCLFTVDDWNFALEFFNHRCAVCGRPAGLWHTLAQDHWIPLSNPNCPGTVPSNIVPLCHGDNGCNNSKHSRDPIEWLNSRYGPQKAKHILKRIEEYQRKTKHVN